MKKYNDATETLSSIVDINETSSDFVKVQSKFTNSKGNKFEFDK